MSTRLTLIGIGVLAVLSMGAAGSVPAAEASTIEVPAPVLTSHGSVCPSGHNPYDLHLWIHVNKWCIPPGVRGQAEFKVQMESHNRSNEHNLDIGQDQIWVVVREFDPDRWTPPQIGQPTYGRPLRTTYRDENVWAIPANADRAYDVLPSGLPTHATHWGFTALSPGETLHPHFHYGDLTYYIPRRHGIRVIDNIVGVAYMKGPDIIALCPPEAWEEHAAAGTF
jgi:hypothetical protein